MMEETDEEVRVVGRRRGEEKSFQVAVGRRGGIPLLGRSREGAFQPESRQRGKAQSTFQSATRQEGAGKDQRTAWQEQT